MDRREFLTWAVRIGGAGVLGGLGAVLSGAPSRHSSPPAARAGIAPAAASPPDLRSPDSASGAARHVSGGAGAASSGGLAIRRENARPGDRRWMLPMDSVGLAGYFDRASASPGDRVTLHAPPGRAFDAEWYRLGWYRGDGARLVRVDRRVGAVRGVFASPSASPTAGPSPRGARARSARHASREPRARIRRPRFGLDVLPDPASGLVEADWDPVLDVEVDADWPSGVYLAVLRSDSGPSGYAPLIVRPAGSSPGAPAPILFVSATLTWQAYNGWGGKSLYSFNSRGPVTATGTRSAATVSFERPYDTNNGAGLLPRWEYPFIRWQERDGREVEYAADLDLALHPEVLAGRRLVVFAGHHEYWSRPMRDALQAAVDRGTSVAFLSANELYWQARLEASATGLDRRVTCYKSAKADPVAGTDPSRTTCRWREVPVSEPEATLVGQMYGHVVARPADWVVAGSRHWLYAKTGLRDGDRIANLVGQEYDTYFPEFAPPGTEILARSPVPAVGSIPGEPGDLPSPALHTATMYTNPVGATVFAAGTFQWSWALDDWGSNSWHGVTTPLDPRVEQMTRNLFDRLAPDG